MSACRVLLLDHSAELGGGELALYDYARCAAGVRAVVFEDGPFVRLLADAAVPVEVLNAGAVLAIRRDHGWRQAIRIAPRLAALTWAIGRQMRSAEVTYANSQKALIVAAIANSVVRRPLVWHLHDILTAAHFSATMRRVVIALSNRFVEHVIANSEATAAAYRAAGGRRPVTAIHNGIDPAPYDQIDRDAARRDLSAMLGVDNAPMLALFGRLSPWKGQEVAIRALATLPGCHLLLVGTAMFGDTACEAELHTLAAREGVATRVHFLGFRSDVASLMAAADIVLHCSTAPEPFGRVIAEGMMAGTPVIASAAGGALEIVTDGQSGMLVPPGDPAALTAAVRTLLDRPDRAETIAAAGRTEANARFSLAAAVDRIDAVIDAVRQPLGTPPRSAQR